MESCWQPYQSQGIFVPKLTPCIAVTAPGKSCPLASTSHSLPLPSPGIHIHAIPSSQVSVNKVPGAQVLHATGNVHHEPNQGLQGQVLVGRQSKLRLDPSSQPGQDKWGSVARKPRLPLESLKGRGKRGFPKQGSFGKPYRAPRSQDSPDLGLHRSLLLEKSLPSLKFPASIRRLKLRARLLPTSSIGPPHPDNLFPRVFVPF